MRCPVLWTRRQLDTNAPHGVISDAMRAYVVQWGVQGRMQAPYDPAEVPVRKLVGDPDDTGVAREEGP